MTHRAAPVPDTARFTAASALQRAAPELVALSLDAKQAHWNVTGPVFLPLHALTDEIAADARTWADRVAERAIALGFTVDGRPGPLPRSPASFPPGDCPITKPSPSSSTASTASSRSRARARRDLDQPMRSDTTSPSRCSRASRSTAGCSERSALTGSPSSSPRRSSGARRTPVTHAG